MAPPSPHEHTQRQEPRGFFSSTLATGHITTHHREPRPTQHASRGGRGLSAWLQVTQATVCREKARPTDPLAQGHRNARWTPGGLSRPRSSSRTTRMGETLSGFPSPREIPEAWSSPIFLILPSFSRIFASPGGGGLGMGGTHALSSRKWWDLSQRAKMCPRPSELLAQGQGVGVEGCGNKSTPPTCGSWDPMTRIAETVSGPKA